MMQAAKPRVQSRNASRLPLLEDAAIICIRFSFPGRGAESGPGCQDRLLPSAATGQSARTFASTHDSARILQPLVVSLRVCSHSSLRLYFAGARGFRIASAGVRLTSARAPFSRLWEASY